MADSALKPRAAAAAASSGPGPSPPVPAAAVTGPGYSQSMRVRMRLLELRRTVRALVARLVPYLGQVVVLLLALCLVALFVPLPPLGTRREDHAPLASGASQGTRANGNAPPVAPLPDGPALPGPLRPDQASAEGTPAEATMNGDDGASVKGTREEEAQPKAGLEVQGNAAAAIGEAQVPDFLAYGKNVRGKREAEKGEVEGEQDTEGEVEGGEKREGLATPAVAEQTSNAAETRMGIEQGAGTGTAGNGLFGTDAGSVQGQVGPAREPLSADAGSGAAAESGANATEDCGNAAVRQGHISWDPAAAAAQAKRAAPRFLLLNCFRGQASKKLLCLRNHVLLAALLNRTLIVPQSLAEVHHPSRTLDTSVFFDLGHAQTCAGPSTAISSAEYLTRYRATHVPLDLLYCWHGPRGACGESSREKVRGRASAWEVTWACPAAVDLEKAQEQLRAGGSHIMPLQIHPPFFTDPLAPAPADTPTKAACLHVAATLHDVMAAFGGVDAGVMAVGDLGDFEIWEGAFGLPQIQFAGDPPIVRSPACPNALIVSPHPALLVLSREIKETLFRKGQGFLAVHWAGRNLHQAECGRSPLQGRCMYSLEQAAMCTVKMAESLGIWSVYVAKGAHKAKMAFFKEALGKYSDGRLTIASLPNTYSGPGAPSSPWLLELKGVDLQAQWLLISSTLDKLVAAQATVFLGNPAAPFSMDIQRLRYGLKQASCDDGFLCDGAAEWNANRKP